MTEPKLTADDDYSIPEPPPSTLTAKNQADSSTIIALSQPRKKPAPKKMTKKKPAKSTAHFRIECKKFLNKK